MRVDGQRHGQADLSREWPGTYCIEGWVGPRTVKPVSSRFTDGANPATLGTSDSTHKYS
jgi:hypothetical protein